MDGERSSRNETPSEDKFRRNAPQISLPKGGGAIRGIGEKFTANPITGTASLTVPIFTTPGRSGFGPQFSLSYDSGSGNGPFGLGWNLSLAAITRKTDKGLPQYQDADESDVFILSGAEDLVPVLLEEPAGTWSHGSTPTRKIGVHEYRIECYRPRIEGLFARIERWTSQSDPTDTFWRSISSENITTWYGTTSDCRIADPGDPMRVFSWLICESYDDKGNAVIYEYLREDSKQIHVSQANETNRNVNSRCANRYLKRVKYGNQPSRLVQPDLSKMTWLFEAVFDYGEGHVQTLAPDSQGREFVLAAKDGAGDWPVRSDPFSSYRSGFEVRTYRLCRGVLMFHHFPELGTNDCLVHSTEFTYAEGAIASFITAITQSGYVGRSDGMHLDKSAFTYLKQSLPPLEFEYSKATIQQEIRDVDANSLENLPNGMDGTSYQWVDLDGEGLSGILAEQAGGWFYKRNISPVSVEKVNGTDTVTACFAPLELIAQQPSLSEAGTGRQQLLDLAGDGRTNLVQFTPPMSGFYVRTAEANWNGFVPFESTPRVAWDDPNLKFVDLTGDGHADVLITEDCVFTWYPSLAEAGFGSAQRAQQTLNEEDGPRLVFADGTASIYLADFSGDGLTDLVRIRNGEVCYWPNLGYGRFGGKVTMDQAPWFDFPDQFDQRRIRLTDIDGSGTTDIIYLGRDGVHLYFNQSGNSWSMDQMLPQFPRVDDLSSVMAVDLLGNGTSC
jgi:hypothetical protein